MVQLTIQPWFAQSVLRQLHVIRIEVLEKSLPIIKKSLILIHFRNVHHTPDTINIPHAAALV